MNWKASKDAARRKQKRQQELYLEDAESENILTGVPTLPAIQAPPYNGAGYVVNSGMNPLLRGDDSVEFRPHAIMLPRGAKQFTAVMQAKLPHSTLLNRRAAESRYLYTRLFLLFLYFL